MSAPAKKVKKKKRTKSKNPPQTIPKSTKRDRTNKALLNLNEKERTIVQALLDGKSQEEALLSAGYAPSTAKTQYKKVIEKSRIQSAIQIIMENHGVTETKLIETMKEGLDAEKLHNTGLGDHVRTEDHAVRHKFMETGLRLMGHGDKKVDIVHHKSHEEQLRELQGEIIEEAEYEEILPEPAE